VGPHAVRELAARGARVHDTGVVPPAGAALEAWHASDLNDPESLARAVAAARPDFLLHLAGQSSAALSFERPAETFRVNAAGTWHLLEALNAQAPQARALIVTSGEIYGPQPDGERAAEDAPLRPVSPYALSKAAADAFAAITAERGQDVIRARSFAHAGPGQDSRFVIPSFARQIAAIEARGLKPVLRVGNLDVTRDFTDVRDVARAYVVLLERGRRGAAYNVCSGAGVRLADVVERLVQRSRAPIRVEPDSARMRPADVPYLVGDPGSIRRDTGWSAEIPLDRTLDDVLAEWRARESPG